MKKILIGLTTVLAILLMSQAVTAQHYTDWTEFEYFFYNKKDFGRF